MRKREADGVEQVKVSYPKFKNGEATVRDVRITPNFGMFYIGTCILNPLTPMSDQHINSPFDFHTLSSKQVMRIKKLSTREKCLEITPNSQE